MNTQVIIKLLVEGFHLYESAPKEVEFLSFNHRHTFEITMGYSVRDPDREIEIFLQRDKVKGYLKKWYGETANFQGMSCEMIAFELLEAFGCDNAVWCEVWEENTGGARVEL